MFKNLTIKARLALTIGLLCGMLVLIGVLGVRGMNAAVMGMEAIYNDNVVPLEHVKEMADHYTVEIVESAHKVRNGSMSWAEAARGISEAQRDIIKRWDEYMATQHTAEEAKLADDIKAQMRVADTAVNKLAAIIGRQDKAALDQFVVNEMYPAIDPLSESLDKLTAMQVTLAKKDLDEGNAQYRSLLITAIVSIVLSILVAGFIGYFLISAINSSLARAIALANRISEGNLDNKIVIDREDEIGTMLKAMQAMNENLVKIVQDVRESAQATASASEQISAGNTNLSQRTEEQASSLEETASSMEEMTSTVKQNADNAARANQMAEATRAQAEKGGHVVGQAVTAMGEINASSRKIADIISTIDGIAFQTNLLALNAAVEAARAGEQGRGFAVVATEVRNLAQRSANAAKEIKTLIEDSVGKVDVGSKLVEQSGVTLNEIVVSVKKVSDVVADIAAASHEQSSGIDQVNQAVVQMDEMTQQNAALVEEAAAASRSLEEQAQVLTQLMGFFKLGDESKLGFNRPVAHVTHTTQAHAPQAHSALAHRPQLKATTGGATARARIEKSASSKPSGGNGSGEWEKF